MAETVNDLPVTQETRVQSLDGEDPLEKGMVIHSSILAWRIPWTDRGAWWAIVHGGEHKKCWFSICKICIFCILLHYLCVSSVCSHTEEHPCKI